MHKIERPALVWPSRQRQQRANPNATLAPAAAAHHQPFFFVQPVNPLAVDRVTLAPQQHPKAPIAKPPALPSQRSQPLAQLIVIAPSVPVAHARPVHGSHTARPPLAHREPASQMSHRPVADESLALIDHYRIVRGALYKGFGAASELADPNALALLAGRLHENLRDCGRLTGELQHGPLLNIQNNVLVSPDYSKAIARIVGAVAPYPEAREAVIAALRDLDAASASAPAITDQTRGKIDG